MNYVFKRLMFGACAFFLNSSVYSIGGRGGLIEDPSQTEHSSCWGRRLLLGGVAVAGAVGGLLWWNRSGPVSGVDGSRSASDGLGNSAVAESFSSVRAVPSAGTRGSELINILIHPEQSITANFRSLVEKACGRYRSMSPLSIGWKYNTVDWVGEGTAVAATNPVKGDWVQQLYGGSEAELKHLLANEPGIKQWTFDEIDQVYQSVKGISSASKCVAPDQQIIVVKGLEAEDLCKLASKHIIQLAGQFDFRESTSNVRSDVTAYPRDRTHGPLVSAEAALGSVKRNLLEEQDLLPDMLTDVLPSVGRESYMQHGYLELFKYQGDMNKLLQHVQANIGKSRMVFQPVLTESNMCLQTHVPCAGPSFQDAGRPAFASPAGQICNLLVSSQYEAMAKAAVIKSRLSGATEPVVVHFSLVGQGSFNNPPEVLQQSIKKATDTVRGENVVLCFHAYKEEDLQTKVAPALKATGIPAKLVHCGADYKGDAKVYANVDLKGLTNVKALPDFRT